MKEGTHVAALHTKSKQRIKETKKYRTHTHIYIDLTTDIEFHTYIYIYNIHLQCT